MDLDSKRTTTTQLSQDKMIKEDSLEELTFSYVFDCLQQRDEKWFFLGFTLSPAYAEFHKSKPGELSSLQHYFDVEVLKAILVFIVYQQTEPVIKWTVKAEMEAYLNQYGGK